MRYQHHQKCTLIAIMIAIIASVNGWFECPADQRRPLRKVKIDPGAFYAAWRAGSQRPTGSKTFEICQPSAFSIPAARVNL